MIGALYLRSQHRQRVAIKEQVPDLVDRVLTKLSDQKELGDEDDEEEPWLFLPNLRDDVLRKIHSPSERDRIWERVVRIVQKNSNVRISQRESKNGEVGRAWEWLGPSGVEAARRRRSGRVSLAPEFRNDTPESQRDMAEVKKWDEPRPIY
jgi:hypothetical protein